MIQEMGRDFINSSVDQMFQQVQNAVELGFITIIAVFLGLPLIIILTILFFRREKSKRHQLQLQVDLATKALEMGQLIPTDFLKIKSDNSNPLNNGIIFIASGLGLSLILWLLVDVKTAVLGLLPAFIGIAFLIIHFMKQKPIGENAQ